jgi:hypothetical protein
LQPRNVTKTGNKANTKRGPKAKEKDNAFTFNTPNSGSLYNIQQPMHPEMTSTMCMDPASSYVNTNPQWQSLSYPNQPGQHYPHQ